MRAAILVDGAFFLKRIRSICGPLSPSDTASILIRGCRSLLFKQHNEEKPKELYRILYYDCPPLAKKFHNPISLKSVDLSKSDIYSFRTELHKELLNKSHLAFRRGYLDGNNFQWNIKPQKLKELFDRTITFNQLTEDDVALDFRQKGVDMRIGLDIASLSYKKLVDQIILISGDSDFVPAAKLARREGIHFILDAMDAPIKDDLYEHIDGLMGGIWKKGLLGRPKRKKKGTTRSQAALGPDL